MQFSFTPHGVCAREIYIDINENDETVNEVRFIGGCAGNTQGVAALAKGRKINELVDILKGIDCNYKGTSCPDQLALALEAISEEL